MISEELEVSLHMAFVEARTARHEFITVEHLLLSLLDNVAAVEVLRACSANIEALRRDLRKFINENTPIFPGEGEVDTQPVVEHAGFNSGLSFRHWMTSGSACASCPRYTFETARLK